MDVLKILKKMGVMADPSQWQISRFHHEEDEGDYRVWKITDGKRSYVLKSAKAYEAEIYDVFFRDPDLPVPRVFQTTEYMGESYLLMEYIDGQDLQRCDRMHLTLALDALISLQCRYWEDRAHAEVGQNYQIALQRRIDRGKYLGDASLEAAYEEFLQIFSSVPRTLCHDDLLPFNVLVSDSRAVLLDWEVAGILPYPTSLARLIAHATEEEDAFFYMSDDDRAFAVEYYYNHFLAARGITYADYRKTLDYFLLYEYCEWVMLGNKYEDADMERYHRYLSRAKELANKCHQTQNQA